MGADGGSIPTRGELVKKKEKPKTVEKEVVLESKWSYCALSSEFLRKPIVACKLGRLYNKEALLRHLLDRSQYSDNATLVSHIRGLKDVVTLNLKDNPSFEDKKKNFTTESQFMCPISELPMNGIHKFFYNWNCGCVFSEKSYKEVKEENCLVCNQSVFGLVIPLYPDKSKEDELRLLLKLSSSNGRCKRKSTSRLNSLTSVSEVSIKKLRRLEPEGSEVYKSIFADPKKKKPEASFLCRSVHGAYL
ncbi:replication termination factor 2-like [Zophobas morio]|uniref:replication termination factor 2-like n=1 Tax=Zophobas morio TaxID=2755281 RepID=UPI0030836A01